MRDAVRRVTRSSIAPLHPDSAAPSPAARIAAIHLPFWDTALCP
jgi:hypothetical protein